MKERPILFSAPMVRAILDGSKTQTRRICKPAQKANLSHVVDAPYGQFGDEDGQVLFTCPHGVYGDRLWVRETFGRSWHRAQPSYFYRATDDKDVGWHPDFDGWKPSIHMPRAASRINLEITGVRVERLQDISEADAWAEGCARGLQTDNGGFFPAEEPNPSGIGARGWDCARDWYADLWESINGAGSWDANPWVWVIEFRKV